MKAKQNIVPIATFVAGLLIGLLINGCAFGQPAADVAAVIADLKKNVPQNQWSTTRYVSLYNRPEKTLDADVAAFNFVINSVSQSRKVHKLSRQGRLIRFNLLQFGISTKLWELLIAENEPYYHITSEVIDPTTGKKKTVFTDGGWVGLKNAATLRTMTVSAGAVCRADWCISQLTTEKMYYLFANVPKTLDGFYKSLGADSKTIEILGANRGANMFSSGVTKKVRRLSRWQGPLGGVWNTYDLAEVKASNDFIRNPTFDSSYDASEQIAAKANGLHIYAIFDGKGNRQDTVPDKIAKDDSDPDGDYILRPLISCVRCHSENGLKSFSNDQKKLIDAGVKVFSKNPNTADVLDAFYNSTKLTRDLARDREDHAEAVKAATGLEFKEVSAALAKIFNDYNYQLVTPQVAAAELGIKAIDPLKKSNDPVLLGLVVGVNVQRKQFESSFQQAALLAASLSPSNEGKKQ